MTEDRYVEINNDLWHYVQDRDTFAKYDFNEVVDLLNAQERRIEALESGFEKDLKAMDSDCMKCEKRYQELIKELEKENKTLKDTINGLTDTLAHTIDITPCGDVE